MNLSHTEMYHKNKGFVNQYPEALVKQLKVERRVKFCIENNTFFTLKK